MGNQIAQAQGPLAVLRRTLGMLHGVSTEVGKVITPVHEVRAVRFWEQFDEGIPQWMTRVAAGAVAAEFGAVAVVPITSPPTGPGGQPLGTIIVVDRVKVDVAGTMRVTTGVTAQATLGGVSNPIYADSRWAPQSGPAPVTLLSGTDPAAIGTVVAGLAANVWEPVEVALAINDMVLLFQSSTANVAYNVDLRGRIIYPAA